MEFKEKILLILFCALFFYGCSTQVPIDCPSSDSTELPSGFLKTFESCIQSTSLTTSITNVPIFTHSPSSTTIPTILYTPTDTPVRTALPTLAGDELQDSLLQNYLTNGGCDLPCWWGITPGISTLDDIYKQLSPMMRIILREFESGVQCDVSTLEPIEANGIGFIGATFVISDGIVEEVSLSNNHISPAHNGALHVVLTEHGKPDEIWLKIIPSPHTTPHINHLVLDYQKKGILFHYVGPTEFVDEHFLLCPGMFENYNNPAVHLWSPKKTITFEELRTRFVNSNYLRIQEFGMGLYDIFFEVFSSPSEECLEIHLSQLPYFPTE